MKFVHLHNHSHYSLLDGLTKLDELINKAIEYEMPAVALTDHGNMHGAIEFYKKAKKAGIKPIIGFEAYVAPRSRHDKEPGIDAKPYHLLLLAKNIEGYKNLLKLASLGHTQGFYYKPRVDKEILAKYSKGVIAASACLAGEIPRLLISGKAEQAKETIKEYQDIFGKENFFLEIQDHPNVPNQDLANKRILELGKELNIPVIATQDSHYINKEDATAQDALIAIQTNTTLNETNRLSMKDEDYSFKSPSEMLQAFKDNPEVISNTVKLAEMCEDIELNLGEWIFPNFELPEGETAGSQLSKQAWESYRTKYADKPEETKKEAEERIKMELDVIETKGYSPYFLIVSDFINEAKRNGIVTNTRGSAAGSFVSYLIGISDVDPLVYMLPFERFLNPFRPSPPDIDMDFADDRRDEVIEYAKKKYGHDKVAQIGTFGTMMARGAVRDVARALGYEYSIGDRISKMIPMGGQGNPMSIKKAKEINPELEEAYQNEKETKEILDLAEKIEGSARHVSVHAAGVVISPTTLTDFIPLLKETRGDKIITQFDMHAVEDAGLLKYDFLGIRNLSILGRAVEIVKKIRGEKIDLSTIPVDDKKTFDLISDGYTIGMFQLGGAGMTRYIKELRPNRITDLMAMIALFRPGPMANIPTYINRKKGKEPVTYLDPRLEKILNKTYGVVTYQDDVLFIALELAGYNWDSVDKFRKAIGKKIPELMAQQEKIFIEGCQTHGKLTKKQAVELWSLFDPFKGYGFNKAHAASYGMIAYQTAYMKANYPGEFMTAVLTAEAGDMDKMAEIINECRRMNIKVLPPDINESFKDFTWTPEENAIRFGMEAVKNVGANVVQNIVQERKANGKFSSMEDLLERVQSRDLNKKSLESLTKVGAFDKFEERNTILNNLDKILDYQKEAKKSSNSNQDSLFSMVEESISMPGLKFEKATPMTSEQRLKLEKELLGIYVSGHPIDKYRAKMAGARLNIATIKKMPDQAPVMFMSMIEQAKKILTKRGDQMMFLKLLDISDEMEAVIFPRTLNMCARFLEEDKCVIIRGKVSRRNGEPSVICDDVKPME